MNKPSEQSYNNHKKFRPIYHYILVPIMLIVWVSSIVHMISDRFSFASVLLFGLSICALILTIIVRAFATDVQDRIIRQEENFRHYVLTGQSLDSELSLAQIIALRFASDEEFPALCAKAAQSGLNPTAIKQSITRWRADHKRV